jgi:hypothetical protein
MKLLLCLDCGDVLALRPEPRRCACGAVEGRYLDDLSTVEQSEGSISIALHNGDLRAAIEAFRSTPDAWRPASCFRAYLNPRCEPDVRYVPTDPRP